MVFQNYALYPHMTAYDNMAFALKMRGVDEGGDRAARAERGPTLGLSEVAEEEAADAFRRAAAARRDGPRDRPRASGLPDG